MLGSKTNRIWPKSPEHIALITTCFGDVLKRNVKPKHEVLPPNRLLNAQQKKALGFWIKALDAAFIPPTPNIIQQWANATLARSKTPDRTVGKDWVYRYMKRFPDIKMMLETQMERQKVIDSKRLDAGDVSLLYY